MVNLPVVLTLTYSPIILFCLANWSITTLTDGKGNLKEIFMTYAYAMYPSVICVLIGIGLSNIVTVNEAQFAVFFFSFGMVLMYAYLFIGLIMIHEYSLVKAFLMVVLTVLAMLIITFVFALFFSLFSNVLFFFETIYFESMAHWFG